MYFQLKSRNNIREQRDMPALRSEVEIQAPAAKFYNVFRKQLEHLPNISTHIHEAKVHEGDWENIGSVKQWEVTIGIN
jgi:uncharacterized membrane protein